MGKKVGSKIGILLALSLFLFAYVHFGWNEFLSLECLKTNRGQLLDLFAERPILVIALYAILYVVSTALSLPGATILTLAGGAIFGLGWGVLIVSFASTVGATLAFLATRFLFRDWVQSKFSKKLVAVNAGITKEGALYLLTLRLIPLFPFFLVNILMGLTPIRVTTFFFVSQLGMLPATVAYINAGTQIAQLQSLQGILSKEILLSLALIGLLPVLSRFLLTLFRRVKVRKFRKPKHFDYNLLVIGGGSAGLVSAYIAAAVKARVALVEKHKMGGDCLNTGCVPSKAFIRSAKITHLLKNASKFGIESANIQVNFAKVMERIQKVIREIAPHDSVERYEKLGVECYSGTAKIRSPYEVEVDGKVLTTKNIVVATGASPRVPNLPGLAEVEYFTSDTIWNLRELPEKLLILGAGAIGCELAQSFARLGAQVSLVDVSERILSREDQEVADFVAQHFQAEGISMYSGHRPLRVEKAKLFCDYRGKEVELPFDRILFALGRQPNVRGFGLEELGVEISPKGFVVADEYLRTTNYPNIYVCGDVTGPYQFTHTASHQAWYVAVNALFHPFKKFPVDYRVIPWCTFVDPEVARVGLNELEAKELGVEYEITRYGIEDLDRAIVEGSAEGFVKVLTKPGSDTILGATIVGEHAGEIISEFVTAMKFGIGLNKILSTIHIYPTFSEANKYVAGNWKRGNAPAWAYPWLERFHRWRRS
jgi:dihydrolipoamide dehydrogenase